MRRNGGCTMIDTSHEVADGTGQVLQGVSDTIPATDVSPVDRAISDMLQGLTEDESRRLVSLGRVFEYQAGQTVIRVGEPGGELFLVLSGTLMQTAESTQEFPEAPSLFLRGDVVGEVPFLAVGIR